MTVLPPRELPEIRSTAQVFGHPIHPVLVPFPIACFIGAWVTDIVYWRSKSMQWETFSVWLLTAGLVMAVFAVLAGLIDFLTNPRIRQLRVSWFHALGSAIVIVLSIVNAFVHSRDGYTAVVPEGLILSTLVVAIMGISTWFGAELVYRQRVGVTLR